MTVARATHCARPATEPRATRARPARTTGESHPRARLARDPRAWVAHSTRALRVTNRRLRQAVFCLHVFLKKWRLRQVVFSFLGHLSAPTAGFFFGNRTWRFGALEACRKRPRPIGSKSNLRVRVSSDKRTALRLTSNLQDSRGSHAILGPTAYRLTPAAPGLSSLGLDMWLIGTVPF